MRQGCSRAIDRSSFSTRTILNPEPTAFPTTFKATRRLFYRFYIRRLLVRRVLSADEGLRCHSPSLSSLNLRRRAVLSARLFPERASFALKMDRSRPAATRFYTGHPVSSDANYQRRQIVVLLWKKNKRVEGKVVLPSHLANIPEKHL